jgi:hypothetical protein
MPAFRFSVNSGCTFYRLRISRHLSLDPKTAVFHFFEEKKWKKFCESGYSYIYDAVPFDTFLWWDFSDDALLPTVFASQTPNIFWFFSIFFFFLKIPKAFSGKKTRKKSLRHFFFFLTHYFFDRKFFFQKNTKKRVFFENLKGKMWERFFQKSKFPAIFPIWFLVFFTFFFRKKKYHKK